MLNNLSSNTTQRVNPQALINQKLPIISTRRAHFAVDQRVWDAEYTETAKINHSYPADLHNVVTDENFTTPGSE